MRLPTLRDLEMHLRTTLVVHAEVHYLSAGGPLGAELASLLTGQKADSAGLPTDSFDGEEVGSIPIEHLAIYRCIVGLHELLLARSLGYGPGSHTLDCDFIEQEYLNLLEMYLSALPEMTFGGYDWGGCRYGAMRDLLLAGQAWHRLLSVVDQGTYGDFDAEELTASDVALIADIEVRSLRNLVGPKKRLRSQEQFQKPNTRIGMRGFATINRFDALDWLIQRKGFAFGPVKPGLLAARLEEIPDAIARGRASLIVSLLLGLPFPRLGKTLCEDECQLRALGDGHGDQALARRVAQHIIELDAGRASDTAPA